ncbi:hypothetical protein ACFPFX_13540 [Streptomyces mauvecolor]|uniref:Uncharacterized protein n=1 Tax=Streptomyces mauvecolor TaxID=58345 RepID=A0ABV9UJQ7_9ACTN
MQKISRLRRIHPGWYAGTFIAVLAIVAQVLYSTGIYDSWRNSRSVDQACGGILAQGELATALDSSELRAKPLDLDDGYLAHCLVLRADSGRNGSLEMSLRWSTTKPSSLEAFPSSSDLDNGTMGQVAPLGGGWSGIVRNDGSAAVQVALDCRNDRSKALVAYGSFAAPGFAPSKSAAALTGLGRVTTETARKTAAKYGCEASGGEKLTTVSSPPYGARPNPAKPLGQSTGSCAALRTLAPMAAQHDVPQAMEYPADAQAPQVNCYLATPSTKPGYGLYAFYGTSAKMFRAGATRWLTSPGEDRTYASAIAKCPQSTEPAAFVITHLLEVHGNDITYPAPHYSPDFANTALKAFADHEAKQRGCTDVRMTAEP